MKRIRVLTIKPLVKPAPSKPKVALHRTDADFYSKLGAISAEKRSLPSSTFSEMAAASHPRRRKNAQPIL